MRKRIITTAFLSVAAVLATTAVSFAQEKSPSESDSAQMTVPSTATGSTATKAGSAPSAEDMAKEMAQMMELSKLNENHKLLAAMAGTWSYTVKMWMDPKGKPSESKGTAIRKTIMDGRYLQGDYSGKFEMPGADGQMKQMDFRGMSLDAYDNAKQKFVSAWIDNMGTGIMVSEGTYDAGSKTFTFAGEYEPMPGMKLKVREVIKMADKDHMSMDYYEDRGQGETKTMEISYTRKK